MVLKVGTATFSSPFGHSDLERFLVSINCDITILGQAQDIKSNDKPCLYVTEGEWATLDERNHLQIVGSDEATTCYILVLVNSKNGMVSLAHLNGWKTQEMIESMLNSFGLVEKLDLYIIGGFIDEKDVSQPNALDILSTLCATSIEINVKGCCIYSTNTVLKNNVTFPKYYGLAYDFATNSVYPANFFDKGINSALRSCRMFSSHNTEIAGERCCFDKTTNQLILHPIKYEVPDFLPLALQLSDSQIRHYFSTSPKQEREGFAHHIKNCFQFLRDNPVWQNVFPNEQPIRYKLVKNENFTTWEKVD